MRRRVAPVLALVLLATARVAPAQTPSPNSPPSYRSNPVDTAHGDRESLLLWPEGAPGALGTAPEDRPKLTLYRAPPAPRERQPGVVVCPGGGYRTWPERSRGQAVAEWLNTLVVSAFVLQYRVRAPLGHLLFPCRTRSAPSASFAPAPRFRSGSVAPRDPGFSAAAISLPRRDARR